MIYIEMITVNGWCAGRKGGGEGRSVQSVGEMGKDFCPNFFQPFLESIDRRSCKQTREFSCAVLIEGQDGL